MKRLMILGAVIFIPATAFAQVTVKDPWVRATVPQQTATGAFMQLSSPTDARLVAASSPVAGMAELHESKMDKGVMKMLAVSGVEIPAGKGAELRPGGYHLMLMNLKRQMKEGEIIPITLVVEGKDKKRQTVEVKAKVRPLSTPAAGRMKQ